MIKEIEIKAPLETLNRIEAMGLLTKWNMDKGVLEITINDETDNDLLKLVNALSETKRVSMRCVKMDGHTINEIKKAVEEQNGTRTNS